MIIDYSVTDGGGIGEGGFVSGPKVQRRHGTGKGVLEAEEVAVVLGLGVGGQQEDSAAGVVEAGEDCPAEGVDADAGDGG